jgi:hypothetical protein
MHQYCYAIFRGKGAKIHQGLVIVVMVVVMVMIF